MRTTLTSFLIVCLALSASWALAQEEGDLKLVGDNAPVEGRVEVFLNGEWGTVCDDFFLEDDAEVVCRQLGYFGGKQVHRYGGGSGPIHMDAVNCTGTESRLIDCPYVGVDGATYHCHTGHAEDVGVVCFETDVSLRVFRLGTMDLDRSPHQTQTVYVTNQEATVTLIVTPTSADATVTVNATDTDTTTDGWQLALAIGDNPVTVTVTNSSDSQTYELTIYRPAAEHPVGTLRLTGGTTLRGRLEVYFRGQWGTVCDDGFDNVDAAVACRQLGHAGGTALSRIEDPDLYEPGSGPVHMDEVACTGTESRLIDCSYADTADCSNLEDVGVACDAAPENPEPPENPDTGNPGSGGGGGGGGGGSGGSQDQHGNMAGQATRVPLGPPSAWTALTPGQIAPADDADYFQFSLPQAGVLVVETTGRTDTRGTVWQGGEELAQGDSGGERRNFRLVVPVEAGEVTVAVAGNGRQTGAYTLEVRLVVGYLENPGPASFQSGIGLLSGWVCEAEEVEIELETAGGMTLRQEAAYGTERSDTEGSCGDTDNGFGAVFNWNRLEDGEHEVIAYVDAVELGRSTVTVTTLGEEFLRGVEGACVVDAFPEMQAPPVTLVWQQTSQNFVLAEGAAPAGENHPGTPGVGYLENPGPNAFQSGVGVISGWVCEAETVEIAIGELMPMEAGYGTERVDTLDTCGDTDNGFGLLFNWNGLGEGEHTVIAYVDEAELARAVVWVTTLGEEFVRGAEGECLVEDFPMPGERTMLEWQQNQQNFVITNVE